MKVAFLFPGQGSQHVGMGKALADAFREAREVFEETDRELGQDLSRLCFEGPEDELRLTANTQPAILAVSVAALRSVEGHGVRAQFVAGHSLGEYSALVAAGALKLGDALRLVRQRGLFMQEAVPAGEGAMAAIIGCDTETVMTLCHQASERGVCSPANFNSQTQTVVAGKREAVEYAVELAKKQGARRTVMLSVSAPFHCGLMQPAAQRLAPILNETRFSDLSMPLITNVDARLIQTADQARDALLRQVVSPVRWSDSIIRLLKNGVSCFIELGPGRVLSGLVRQMSRECRVVNVGDADSLAKAVGEVRAAGSKG